MTDQPVPQTLTDADLLAWTVVLGYRDQQRRRGLTLVLLPYPPCPTCSQAVDGITTYTILDQDEERITMHPCGHAHITTTAAAIRLHDHASSMIEALESADRTPGGHAWTTDDVIQEARARVGGPQPVSKADVKGRCPACRATSLFLGDGGYVTCARIECPDPTAADDLLHGKTPSPQYPHQDGDVKTLGIFPWTDAMTDLYGAPRPVPTADEPRCAICLTSVSEHAGRFHDRGFGPASKDAQRTAHRASLRYLLDRADRNHWLLPDETVLLRKSVEAEIRDNDQAHADAEWAKAELARLREGEELLPAGQYPATASPAQWLWQWNQATPAQRLDRAARIIEASQEAETCFVADHPGQIEHWRRRAEQAEAATARVRALLGTHLGPLATAAVRTALAGRTEIEPREQHERPAHPDGTPYTHAELTAEGWDYCDGCRLWTTATPDRPHQCAETYMQAATSNDTTEEGTRK